MMVALLPVILWSAIQEVVVPEKSERSLMVRLPLVMVVTVSVLTSTSEPRSVRLSILTGHGSVAVVPVWVVVRRTTKVAEVAKVVC